MANPNENYKGQWKTTDWPPYKFMEYPKWVRNAEGNDVIVMTQREELAIVSMVPAGEIDPVLTEKNRLLEIMDSKEQELQASEKEKAALASQLSETNDMLVTMSKRMAELEKLVAVPEKAEKVLPAPPPAAPKVGTAAADGVPKTEVTSSAPTSMAELLGKKVAK